MQNPSIISSSKELLLKQVWIEVPGSSQAFASGVQAIVTEDEDLKEAIFSRP